MSSPELSVVCKSCGSEVSPYVTECPYCGTRLRKRAPKLERHGDELTPKETRRARRERRRQERATERASRALAELRPYVTVAAILAPSVLLVVQRAAGLSPFDVGGLVGPVGSEWWRFLAAPWVYEDAGYLFVAGVAIAIFGTALERRLGPAPLLVLLVACGGLGMLAADGLETAVGDGAIVAAGGNGVALGALCGWAVLRRQEGRALADDATDWIGVAVAAAVLLALPLVEDLASVWAGIAGGAVGGLCGAAAGLQRT